MKNFLSNVARTIGDKFQSLINRIKPVKKYKRKYPAYSRGSDVSVRAVRGRNGYVRNSGQGGPRIVLKKRFAMFVAGACVAVMVPVIVLGSMDGAIAAEGNQAAKVEAEAQATASDAVQPDTISNTEIPLEGATQQTADNGTLTASNTTGGQVADGGTATTGGEVQTDGTVAAADGTDPAADGTTPAADGTEPAADGTTPAADGTDPAADGTTPAADGGDAAVDPAAGDQTDPAALDESMGVMEDGTAGTSEAFTPIILIPEVKSSEVPKLQARLMELNYMDKDEPTEYYGGMTQQAVSYFQRKNGLPVDGVAGIETQQVLFSDEAKLYTVSNGDEGIDVSGFQERLAELDYPVSSTGFFGDETESAVKYFQRMNGLDDDGTIGAMTKDVLFSEQAIPAEPPPEPEQSSSSGSGSGGGSSSGGGRSSGGGGGGGGASTTHIANPGSVQAFIDAAYAQLGKPYRTAGKGPDSFDCSGLVYYALSLSGNGIGYMTSGGWAGSGYATVGSIDDLQPGDVICFTGHVGVYVGGGTMVDASSSNGCVVERGLGSWARNNFICGKRPL